MTFEKAYKTWRDGHPETASLSLPRVALHFWNDALDLAAMSIEKATERSRIVDAGLNGKTMQPCPYAAEIRRLKAKP